MNTCPVPSGSNSAQPAAPAHRKMDRTGNTGPAEPVPGCQCACRGQQRQKQHNSDVTGKSFNRAKGGANLGSLTQSTRALSRDMASHVLPEATRGTQLLCCVTLCLLRAGESQVRWDVPPAQPFRLLRECPSTSWAGLSSISFPYRVNGCWSHPIPKTPHQRPWCGGRSEMPPNLWTQQCVLVPAASGAGTQVSHSVL